MLSATASSTPARAAPPEQAALPTSLLPNLASHHERALREEREALEQQLGALAKVRSAEVVLERAHPAHVPLDVPMPPPRLRVILHTLGEGPQPEVVDQALQSFLAHNPGAQLDVVRHAVSPPAHEADGPPQEEETPLKHVLALSLSANVMLATFLLARAVRARGRKSQLSRAN